MALLLGKSVAFYIPHLLYVWIMSNLRDYDDAAVVLPDGLGQRVDGFDILEGERFRFRLCL